MGRTALLENAFLFEAGGTSALSGGGLMDRWRHSALQRAARAVQRRRRIKLDENSLAKYTHNLFTASTPGLADRILLPVVKRALAATTTAAGSSSCASPVFPEPFRSLRPADNLYSDLEIISLGPTNGAVISGEYFLLSGRGAAWLKDFVQWTKTGPRVVVNGGGKKSAKTRALSQRIRRLIDRLAWSNAPHF